MISTVFGTMVSDEIATADYWLRHIVQPVLYLDAIRLATSHFVTSFVEMGPDDTLSRMTKRISVESHCNQGAIFGVLPSREIIQTRKFSNRLLQAVVCLTDSTLFSGYLHGGIMKQWLRDHVLYGEIVLPGAAYFEMILAALSFLE
eukprot:gene44580-56455_t